MQRRPKQSHVVGWSDCLECASPCYRLVSSLHSATEHSVHIGTAREQRWKREAGGFDPPTSPEEPTPVPRWLPGFLGQSSAWSLQMLRDVKGLIRLCLWSALSALEKGLLIRVLARSKSENRQGNNISLVRGTNAYHLYLLWIMFLPQRLSLLLILEPRCCLNKAWYLHAPLCSWDVLQLFLLIWLFFIYFCVIVVLPRDIWIRSFLKIAAQEDKDASLLCLLEHEMCRKSIFALTWLQDLVIEIIFLFINLFHTEEWTWDIKPLTKAYDTV